MIVPLRRDEEDEMDEETPVHYPQTQGLELITHPAVADAYTLFWAQVSEMANRIKQRHAARQEVVPDTVSSDVEKLRQEAA